MEHAARANDAARSVDNDTAPLPRPARISTSSPATLAVQAANRAERQRVFGQVHELKRDGWTIHRIARHVGLDRNTISTYPR